MTERLNSPGWATYLRVSDEDKQSPERSFAMQRKRIQEQLLSPSEYPFKHEYCDMLTGTNPNRADYQQLLTDAQAGKFSHLGLYRADRFGRNAVERLQAATTLISLGIKIRVANMPTLTAEESDGFFMFLIQIGLAQREVDVLRKRSCERDGWLYTGDIARMDKEGFFYIVDRKKELIKPGGYQVWPRDVEEVIATHPKVMEVGAAGIPDAYRGETVKAWVVVKPGETLSEEEVRDWCKERLAKFKVPTHVEFRDELPKTTVGKILRRELVR